MQKMIIKFYKGIMRHLQNIVEVFKINKVILQHEMTS